MLIHGNYKDIDRQYINAIICVELEPEFKASCAFGSDGNAKQANPKNKCILYIGWPV